MTDDPTDEWTQKAGDFIDSRRGGASNDSEPPTPDEMTREIQQKAAIASKQGGGQWVPYTGPQGGEGWKNVDSGNVRYTDDPPGDTLDPNDLDAEDIAQLADQAGRSPDEVRQQLADALGKPAVGNMSQDEKVETVLNAMEGEGFDEYGEWVPDEDLSELSDEEARKEMEDALRTAPDEVLDEVATAAVDDGYEPDQPADGRPAEIQEAASDPDRGSATARERAEDLFNEYNDISGTTRKEAIADALSDAWEEGVPWDPSIQSPDATNRKKDWGDGEDPSHVLSGVEKDVQGMLEYIHDGDDSLHMRDVDEDPQTVAERFLESVTDNLEDHMEQAVGDSARAREMLDERGDRATFELLNDDIAMSNATETSLGRNLGSRVNDLINADNDFDTTDDAYREIFANLDEDEKEAVVAEALVRQERASQRDTIAAYDKGDMIEVETTDGDTIQGVLGTAYTEGMDPDSNDFQSIDIGQDWIRMDDIESVSEADTPDPDSASAGELADAVNAPEPEELQRMMESDFGKRKISKALRDTGGGLKDGFWEAAMAKTGTDTYPDAMEALDADTLQESYERALEGLAQGEDMRGDWSPGPGSDADGGDEEYDDAIERIMEEEGVSEEEAFRILNAGNGGGEGDDEDEGPEDQLMDTDTGDADSIAEKMKRRAGLAGTASKAEWVPYEGPQGGTGWQNTETGEVDYSEDAPGGTPEGVPDSLDELEEAIESGELTEEDLRQAVGGEGDDGGNGGGADDRGGAVDAITEATDSPGMAVGNALGPDRMDDLIGGANHGSYYNDDGEEVELEGDSYDERFAEMMGEELSDEELQKVADEAGADVDLAGEEATEDTGYDTDAMDMVEGPDEPDYGLDREVDQPESVEDLQDMSGAEMVTAADHDELVDALHQSYEARGSSVEMVADMFDVPSGPMIPDREVVENIMEQQGAQGVATDLQHVLDPEYMSESQFEEFFGSSDGKLSTAERVKLRARAPDYATLKAEWVPYEGPQGGKGWKNVDSGQVRYTDDPPGEALDEEELRERAAEEMVSGDGLSDSALRSFANEHDMDVDENDTTLDVAQTIADEADQNVLANFLGGQNPEDVQETIMDQGVQINSVSDMYDHAEDAGVAPEDLQDHVEAVLEEHEGAPPIDNETEAALWLDENTDAAHDALERAVGELEGVQGDGDGNGGGGGGGGSNGEESDSDSPGYDTPPDDMSDQELRGQHEDLLRLQRQETDAGNSERAREMARRRQELWDEAQERGIDIEGGDDGGDENSKALTETWTEKANSFIEDHRPDEAGDDSSGPDPEAFTEAIKEKAAIFDSPGMTDEKAEWVPYEGPQGGTGWQNTETGDVEYTDDPPGEVLSQEDIASGEADLSEVASDPEDAVAVANELGMAGDLQESLSEELDLGEDATTDDVRNALEDNPGALENAMQQAAADDADDAGPGQSEMERRAGSQMEGAPGPDEQGEPPEDTDLPPGGQTGGEGPMDGSGGGSGQDGPTPTRPEGAPDPADQGFDEETEQTINDTLGQADDPHAAMDEFSDRLTDDMSGEEAVELAEDVIGGSDSGSGDGDYQPDTAAAADQERVSDLQNQFDREQLDDIYQEVSGGGGMPDNATDEEVAAAVAGRADPGEVDDAIDAAGIGQTAEEMRENESGGGGGGDGGQPDPTEQVKDILKEFDPRDEEPSNPAEAIIQATPSLFEEGPENAPEGADAEMVMDVANAVSALPEGASEQQVADAVFREGHHGRQQAERAAPALVEFAGADDSGIGATPEDLRGGPTDPDAGADPGDEQDPFGEAGRDAFQTGTEGEPGFGDEGSGQSGADHPIEEAGFETNEEGRPVRDENAANAGFQFEGPIVDEQDAMNILEGYGDGEGVPFEDPDEAAEAIWEAGDLAIQGMPEFQGEPPDVDSMEELASEMVERQENEDGGTDQNADTGDGPAATKTFRTIPEDPEDVKEAIPAYATDAVRERVAEKLTSADTPTPGDVEAAVKAELGDTHRATQLADRLVAEVTAKSKAGAGQANTDSEQDDGPDAWVRKSRRFIHGDDAGPRAWGRGPGGGQSGG